MAILAPALISTTEGAMLARSAQNPAIPHLRNPAVATQLMIASKPFLNLEGEVGNSSSSLDDLRPLRPKLVPQGQGQRPQRPPNFLGPDDKTAFSPAPAGFDVRREGIAHGKTEVVEYVTPPRLSPKDREPVLY